MLLPLIMLAACRKADSRPTLTVSVEPQRYLLERIAGDDWEVKSLLEKGSDPESFDPSISAISAVMDSKAYFYNGQIPFEEKLRGRIASETGSVAMFDTSDGIELISGTHSHHDHDGDNHSHLHDHDGEVVYDPHTWSSVKNAMIISDNMLKAMIELDPDNASIYTANHAKLRAELQSLDDRYAAALSDRKGDSFMMWHPSLSYFARDYGLNQMAVDSENKELSAAGFKDKIDRARSERARVFIIQPEYDRRRSDELARQIGAQVVEVNLLSYDWIDELDKVVSAMAGQ